MPISIAKKLIVTQSVMPGRTQVPFGQTAMKFFSYANQGSELSSQGSFQVSIIKTLDQDKSNEQGQHKVENSCGIVLNPSFADRHLNRRFWQRQAG